MTQRIELRKKAATSEGPVVCWNRVGGSASGSTTNLYWPNGCGGDPNPDRVCTQATVPLTAVEIYNFNQWVQAGRPFIPGCGMPTPTPTPTGPGVNWATPQVMLKAGVMKITADGKVFRGIPDPGTTVNVHSVGGNPTYTTLEVTWREQGVEMRLYMYITANCAQLTTACRWRVTEIRTYNGLAQGDWIYYTADPDIQNMSGQYAYGWGTNQINLSSNPPTPGAIEFSNLELHAFRNYLTVTRTPTPTIHIGRVTCGGIQGNVCPTGTTCIYENGSSRAPYPDALGNCLPNTDTSCKYARNGAPCSHVVCPTMAPCPSGSFCKQMMPACMSASGTCQSGQCIPGPITRTPTPTPPAPNVCLYGQDGRSCQYNSCSQVICYSNGTCVTQHSVGGTCTTGTGVCRAGRCAPLPATPTPTPVFCEGPNGTSCNMGICPPPPTCVPNQPCARPICRIQQGTCQNNRCIPTVGTFRVNVRNLPLGIAPSVQYVTPVVEVIDGDGTPGTGPEGFTVRVSIWEQATGMASIPPTPLAYGNEGQTWAGNVRSPQRTGYFRIQTEVICSVSGSPCATRYGLGRSVINNNSITISTTGNLTLTPTPTCYPRPRCLNGNEYPDCAYAGAPAPLPPGAVYCPLSPTPSIACKTGVNSFSVGTACGITGTDAYRGARYSCYDGTSGTVGSICMTSRELADMAQQACAGRSNCRLSPTPTCVPLPTCATEGVVGSNGTRVYCDLRPGVNYCRRTDPADVDGNGRVDIFDVNRVLRKFNQTGPKGWIVEDIDDSGKVDVFDFNAIFRSWSLERRVVGLYNAVKNLL